jgi:hypothetical protein
VTGTEVRTSRKPAVWIATGIAAAAVALGLFVRSKPSEIREITGAVLRQDSDLGKQFPVANARVFLDDGLSEGAATSDSAGLFKLKLRPGTHIGQMVTLQVQNPDYHPLTVSEFLTDRLYVIRITPLSDPTDASLNPSNVLSEIRVRYTTKNEISVNAGSALKTFEVVNVGDVPCDRHSPCSPNGKWKAAIGGASLDAGPRNSFHDVRLSCIAGPCPFTKIEKDSFSGGGSHIGVTIRNWSDTTTFLLEAEVTHTMKGDVTLQSFPAIFERTMSFTLPASAQGPSIEAAINGQEIVYPLGPTLNLSWAVCDVRISGGTKLYRCVLKPEYRFR